MKLLTLTIYLTVSIPLSALAEETNSTNYLAATGSQTAPMTVMINGPTGKGTVPIEFWADKISIGMPDEHLEREVGIYRLPQVGYIKSLPSNYVGGLNNLLRATNNLWWVPEVGLVLANSDTFITLTLYTTKTESRSEARSLIEDKSRNQEKPNKGVLRGESRRVDLRDALGRDLFFLATNSVVMRQFNITMLVYTNKNWVIDMESMDGKAAQIVLDSNFKLKKAKRTK